MLVHLSTKARHWIQGQDTWKMQTTGGQALQHSNRLTWPKVAAVGQVRVAAQRGHRARPVAPWRKRPRLCSAWQGGLERATCAGEADGQGAGQAGPAVAGRGAAVVSAPQLPPAHLGGVQGMWGLLEISWLVQHAAQEPQAPHNLVRRSHTPHVIVPPHLVTRRAALPIAAAPLAWVPPACACVGAAPVTQQLCAACHLGACMGVGAVLLAWEGQRIPCACNSALLRPALQPAHRANALPLPYPKAPTLIHTP